MAPAEERADPRGRAGPACGDAVSVYYLGVVRILRINREHPLYEQEKDLRERGLLAPIGKSFAWYEREYGADEARFEHFVAVIDHPTGERVVGSVCLLPDHPEEGVGKLTQMVVDPQRRREGIGRKLVASFERRATGELGLMTLYCHAQLAAVPFYERLGWRIEGDEFEEAGIGHHKMVFRAE